MSHHNSGTDEPDYSQLFVYAGPEQPDPSNMTTYASESFDFTPPSYDTDRTVPGQANIIGSSHYINLGASPLPYREITSCRPIGMVKDFDPVVATYDITNGIDDTLIREYAGCRVEVDIVTHDLAEFDESPITWDLSYTFGDDEYGAPTTISLGSAGWVTCHTYPEFDISLWTETTMFPVE